MGYWEEEKEMGMKEGREGNEKGEKRDLRRRNRRRIGLMEEEMKEKGSNQRGENGTREGREGKYVELKGRERMKEMDK